MEKDPEEHLLSFVNEIRGGHEGGEGGDVPPLAF